MIKALFVSSVLASFASLGAAECPNGCNGHGKCTSYDMCICNRNWQANDCSERVCQFGLAHVDTPKGDLDMSGDITGPDLTVAVNSFTFPYGTSEQFPQGRDSDLNEVTNSAHYYMECSNKGSCNRETGECECFDGYDGAACQRASCPGWPDSCSGHGVCKTIRQLAYADNQNIYELWDRHSTMGCECDHGFSGPDCSERKCKFGIDPLYYDDSTTIKYSTWDFAILTSSATEDFTDGMNDAGSAYFALRVFDMHGEDWLTEPIEYGSSCATVINALEALPNKVIPAGSLNCIRTKHANSDPLSSATWSSSVVDSATDPSFTADDRPIYYKLALWEITSGKSSNDAALGQTISGTIYRIKFAGNPGALRQPEIERYLDGTRSSIQTAGTLVTKVWTDGQQGESVDYFADICEGVTVTIDTSGDSKLSGMTATEQELLKACLGDSDFDVSNNVEKYDWDHGSNTYPHIIKLVLTTASAGDGGYYAAVVFDGTDFKLMKQFYVPDLEATDNFDVYTTQGTLALTSSNAKVTFGFGKTQVTVAGTSYLQGDLSCEINDNNVAKRASWTRNSPDSQTTCLNKTNIVTFLSATYAKNPRHINLYSVEKIYNDPSTNTFVIETDLSTNWGAITSESFRVYKFFPSSESSYTYVSQCSNRGICNSETGTCECFHGYTSDSCSEQNSLAV